MEILQSSRAFLPLNDLLISLVACYIVTQNTMTLSSNFGNKISIDCRYVVWVIERLLVPYGASGTDNFIDDIVHNKSLIFTLAKFALVVRSKMRMVGTYTTSRLVQDASHF